MKIAILSSVETYLPAIRKLCNEIEISAIVGLGTPARREAVSGYYSYKQFAQSHGIPFYEVDDYSLACEASIATLESVEADLLLTLGWQRLLPDRVLSMFPGGVIGVHGSAFGITGGRGRSPLNWALIMGAQKFFVSIFFMDAGIDDGKILAEYAFPLSQDEDIRSAYDKLAESTAELILSCHNEARLAPEFAQAQEGSAAYLPMRTPEDGAIDWHRSSAAVLRFIRALSRPYPGAFCEIDGCTLKIWAAEAFSSPIGVDKAVPGTIVFVDAESEIFIVRTKDGAIKIVDYTMEGTDETIGRWLGQTLGSVNFAEQIDQIISRHSAKYPTLPIANEVLALSSGRNKKP